MSGYTLILTILISVGFIITLVYVGLCLVAVREDRKLRDQLRSLYPEESDALFGRKMAFSTYFRGSLRIAELWDRRCDIMTGRDSLLAALHRKVKRLYRYWAYSFALFVGFLGVSVAVIAAMGTN